MKTSIVAVLTLGAILLAEPGGAQGAPPPPSLSIRQAVEFALESHPRLKAADHEVAAARARQTQAQAIPNPNLTLQADTISWGNPQMGNYLAGISQPLLADGSRRARLEVARLDTASAELQREELRRELATQVKNAYVQTLHALAEVRIAQLSEEAASTLVKSLQTRHRAGQLPRVEGLRAEVELSRARREVAVAQSRVALARARLNATLGREAQTPIEVQELPSPAPASLPPLASLVESSLRHRIDLQRAVIGIQRESAAYRQAQSSLWTGTEVSLAGGLAGGQPVISGGLTLPVPLYRQQGELAEAEANREQAEAKREELANQITLEVEEAYREARIAAEQAELLTKTFIPQAERLWDNARRRLSAGEGSGAEVSEARRALRETRLEAERALVEYRLALVKLEQAVGADLFQP